MRNDPAPKKYMDEGLSPLHSRVMALFDTLEDKHHQCSMDNLYNSVAFCRAAVNHKHKVLCHGVTRKGRGLPNNVIQEVEKSKKEQLSGFLGGLNFELDLVVQSELSFREKIPGYGIVLFQITIIKDFVFTSTGD